MPIKILFIERKFGGFVSIENVFRTIARNLSADKYKTEFQKLEFGNNLIGIINNLLLFKKNKADIYHITGHIHYIALILPRNRTVLTIHDLGILFIRKGVRRWLLKKLFLDLPVKKLRYLTAISEKTKEEIIRFTNCSPDKIRVIENPLDENFICEQQKLFNKSLPLILQIGTMPNKNLDNLIFALKGINCRLRIIGRLNKNQINLLFQNGINYENDFDLSDAQMKEEYRSANVAAFCSLYEGFGLPLIEAQSMGIPVLTSDINPLKEISGGAAYLANPQNPESIKDGILKIINDDAFREKIITEGLENVKRFEAVTVAEKYQNLYLEILNDSL